MKGNRITIAGSTSPANNGTFIISAFVNATTIRYVNTDVLAIAEAFPGTWSVSISTLKGKFLIDGASNNGNCSIERSYNFGGQAVLVLEQNSTVTFPARIMEPSAELTGTSSTENTLNLFGIDSVVLSGLRIRNTGGGKSLSADACGHVALNLCQLDGVGSLVGPNQALNVDTVNACTFTGRNALSGHAFTFVNRTLFDGADGLFGFGILQFPTPHLLSFAASTFNACGSFEIASDGGPQSSISFVSLTRCKLTGCPDPTAAMYLHAGRNDLSRLDVSGNAGSAFRADANGTTFASRILTTGMLNGRYGFEAIAAHDVQLSSTIAVLATPVRGVLGDMKAGNGPTRTYVDFIAATPASGRPRLIEYDINTPVAGTGTSFAFAASVVNLTGPAASFTADMVGRLIVIQGAAPTVGNNGVFVVSGFVSATEITYVNPAGSAEAFAGTWKIVPINGASGTGARIWQA